jgi:hypothetical protein
LSAPVESREIESSTFREGTFENLVLGPGEVYRPLTPKKLLAVYKKGSCFGEADLLHSRKRSTAVVCIGQGMMALVPKKDYLVRCPLLVFTVSLMGHEIFEILTQF